VNENAFGRRTRMRGAAWLRGHPLKGPLSRDKQSVTENLIKYFPFVFLMETHSTFFAPVISSIAGCGYCTTPHQSPIRIKADKDTLFLRA
jgi:hypothetical protein